MFKRLFLTMILIAVSVSFSACRFFDTNINGMLKSPELTGEMEKINSALLKYTGDKIKLHRPYSGDYLSAFILKDIDNDNSEEVFAFYSKQLDNNYNELHMNYLRNQNGWKSVNDIVLDGEEIELVRFFDVNNDSKKEVFLKIKNTAVTSDVIEGYMIDDAEITQCFRETASVFVGMDINSDNVTEILTINLDTAKKNSVAIAYKVDRNEYKSIGNCSLDGKILSYREPIVSCLSNGKPAIFIDAQKTANSYITEIVLWDKELKAPLYDSVSLENTITLRQAEIFSKDYDEDGCCEIPFLQYLPSKDEVEENNRTYVTQWRNFDSREFKTVANEMVNYYDGYSIEVPDELLGSFTLQRDLENRERVFYYFDKIKNKFGNEFLRIKAFSKKEWKSNKDKTYSVLGENSKDVFAVKISDDKFNSEDLKLAFKVIP